jgi:hypothetical protein
MLRLMSQALSILLLCLLCALVGQAQGRGHLTGVVHNASKAAVGGVIVVVTNQVTSDKWQVHSRQDGSFSLHLRAGAYRITVAAPYVAKFDKDKNYGEFTNARGEVLENVIVEDGKDTSVDIQSKIEKLRSWVKRRRTSRLAFTAR